MRDAACFAIARYIRLVHATGRWDVAGGEVPRALHAAGQPFILAFWHGRLLMMPMAWDRRQPIHMLISSHRDGRLIAQSVRHFGIASIAGSSRHGGITALRGMVRVLREGACVGMTPDGPRGPAEVASNGILAAARLARVPIVPLAFAARPERRLRSWDRFRIAFPFGRGVFVWGEPIDVTGLDEEAGRALVETSLKAAGQRADRRMAPRPALWRLWGLTAEIMAPGLRLLLARRRAAGKEDPVRWPERMGVPSLPRPDGPLVWIHAASVGEATAALPLAERLRGERPEAAILVTTGTRAAASLFAAPRPGPLHQFVPLDRPSWVRRFLDHWRPDLAIFVESEIWPNLLLETAARGVPLALVNARLSERSVAGWRRAGDAGRALFAAFDLALAQDEAQAVRLGALGVGAIAVAGDLKSAAPALAADPEALARLERAIADRPAWLAASTHDGEEAIAAAVHRALAPRWPGLLTIVAQRHPARAQALAAGPFAGLAVTRRSAGALPDAASELYLADTFGELGLLFRAAPVVFLGGSLVPKGGHNLFEPALLGAAILHGPDTANCRPAASALAVAGASEVVTDAASLADAVDRLLRDGAMRAARGAAARRVAEAARAGTLDAILGHLAPLLERAAPRATAMRPAAFARDAVAGP